MCTRDTLNVDVQGRAGIHGSWHDDGYFPSLPSTLCHQLFAPAQGSNGFLKPQIPKYYLCIYLNFINLVEKTTH